MITLGVLAVIGFAEEASIYSVKWVLSSAFFVNVQSIVERVTNECGSVIKHPTPQPASDTLIP